MNPFRDQFKSAFAIISEQYQGEKSKFSSLQALFTCLKNDNYWIRLSIEFNQAFETFETNLTLGSSYAGTEHLTVHAIPDEQLLIIMNYLESQIDIFEKLIDQI